MKTAASFILLTIITLLSVSKAFAKTAVNVTSNTNSTSTSNSSMKSNTDIKITTNGETKEFHSDGTNDIDYTSEDGKTKVSVKSNTVTGSSSSSSNEKSSDKESVNLKESQPSPSPEEEEEEASEVVPPKVEKKQLPGQLVDQIKSILNGIASTMLNLFSRH